MSVHLTLQWSAKTHHSREDRATFSWVFWGFFYVVGFCLLQTLNPEADSLLFADVLLLLQPIQIEEVDQIFQIGGLRTLHNWDLSTGLEKLQNLERTNLEAHRTEQRPSETTAA